MTITLPKLPFGPNDLAPYISAETLDYHYGKHHQAYVTKLNALLEGHALAGASLEDIIRQATGPVFNNAAQIWNHSFYWQCLSAEHDAALPKDVESALTEAFGAVDAFKAQFTQTALNTFGSGWAWLVREASGQLAIVSTANAGCPLTAGQHPILTCDVWEHAYYIDTRNNRAEYVKNFWHLVNWTFVKERLALRPSAA